MFEKYFQIIIDEISKLVPTHICFIDCEGHILKSSNPSRIGQFHPYAKKLVDEDLDQLVVDKDDPEVNVKKGVHSALRLDEQIIGVIGITGEPSEVLLFSKAIRVLTELMLKNLLSNEQANILAQARGIFFQEYLLHNSRKSQEQYLTQGKSLGLDMNTPRSIIVLRLLELPAQPDLLLSSIVSQCNNHNEKHVSGSVTFLKGTDIICFYPCSNPEDIYGHVSLLKKEIENKFDCKACIGCSNIYTQAEMIPALYETACMLAEISKNSNGQIIQQWHLSPELLIKSLSHGMRHELYNEIFHNCSKQEIEDHTQLLLDYFEYNGSIKDIAEKRFVHKNTIHYQLTKIHQQTGYNPRNMKDAFCLYLAIMSK